MRKSSVLLLAVMGALLMTTTAAVAEETRERWLGRDLDNDRLIWSASNTNGDTWVLKRNGVAWGNYEATATTKEYIEVKSGKNIIRFYADKMSINKNGSKFQFITLAKGKWRN